MNIIDHLVCLVALKVKVKGSVVPPELCSVRTMIVIENLGKGSKKKITTRGQPRFKVKQAL